MARRDHPGHDPDEGPENSPDLSPPDGSEDADASESTESENEEQEHAREQDEDRRVIRIDDIRRRAQEKYDHLPPEERDAAAAKDLQDSIDRVSRVAGASLTPISEWQRDYTRRMAESLSKSMPKIDFSVLSNALDTSSISGMSSTLAAIAPTFSVFGDEQIAGMLTAMQRSLQSVATEREADSQEHEEDDEAVATQETPVDEPTGSDSDDATDHDAVLDWAAAILQLQESLREQATATWRVLDTLRDQSDSIHKTAEAMLVQLAQSERQLTHTEQQLEHTETMLDRAQQQLEHARYQAQVQAQQHDEIMATNKLAIRVATASAIAAMVAVFVSLFSPPPVLEIPDGHMIVPEDDATVTDTPTGEADEGEDDEL